MVSGIKKSSFPFPRVLYRAAPRRYRAPMLEATFRQYSLAFEVSFWVRLVAGLVPRLCGLLSRFALAFAMVLVCAGTMSACPSVAHLELATDSTIQDADLPGFLVSAEESTPKHGFEASQSFPEFDVAAVEFDADDHELLSNAGSLSLALVLHSVPHLRENAFSVSRAINTSRSVVSAGLPRGPPEQC